MGTSNDCSRSKQHRQNPGDRGRVAAGEGTRHSSSLHSLKMTLNVWGPHPTLQSISTATPSLMKHLKMSEYINAWL